MTTRPTFCLSFEFAGFEWPRTIVQLPKGTPAQRLSAKSDAVGSYSHGPEPLEAGDTTKSFYLGDMGQPELRWKWADAVDGVGRHIRHTGWFTTDDGDGDTVRGLVMRLPRSRGFIAGWGMGVGMIAAVDYGNTYADESEAAYAADNMANNYAEKERDYQREEAAKLAEEERAEASAYIEQAAALYGSDEIEFDDNPTVSRGDEGCFVQAWVWVPDSAVNQNNEEV